MKHVLPRLLRPEAPGGTWTSGKTGRGRKEGGGITLTLEDEIIHMYVHQVRFVVLTDSMVSLALTELFYFRPESPIFCETGLPCVLAFSLSLSLSLAFTSFMMAIISSGHELSLLRAGKR